MASDKRWRSSKLFVVHSIEPAVLNENTNFGHNYLLKGRQNKYLSLPDTCTVVCVCKLLCKCLFSSVLLAWHLLMTRAWPGTPTCNFYLLSSVYFKAQNEDARAFWLSIVLGSLNKNRRGIPCFFFFWDAKHMFPFRTLQSAHKHINKQQQNRSRRRHLVITSYSVDIHEISELRLKFAAEIEWLIGYVCKERNRQHKQATRYVGHFSSTECT